MVLSHYEVTEARFVNGTCQNARKIRESMRLALCATSFLEQVILHRDVQNSLHILNSSYNKHHSEEYKFNCTVLHNPSYFSRVPMLIGPGWGQRKSELLRIRTQVLTDIQRDRARLGTQGRGRNQRQRGHSGQGQFNNNNQRGQLNNGNYHHTQNINQRARRGRGRFQQVNHRNGPRH